eukprot:301798-Pyramimonas_sp.AAC.1
MTESGKQRRDQRGKRTGGKGQRRDRDKVPDREAKNRGEKGAEKQRTEITLATYPTPAQKRGAIKGAMTER